MITLLFLFIRVLVCCVAELILHWIPDLISAVTGGRSQGVPWRGVVCLLAAGVGIGLIWVFCL